MKTPAQTTAADNAHPGAILRRKVLPALHLSVTQAARDLLVTRQTLHRILAGEAAITPEMALRLEKLCGVSSTFWLERQHMYDLLQIRMGGKTFLSSVRSHRLPGDLAERIEAGHDS